MTEIVSFGDATENERKIGLYKRLFTMFLSSLILLATTVWLVTILVDRTAHRYAERQALAWAEFAGQHLLRIEELAQGAAPLPDDLEKISEIESLGDIFSFKLFSPEGVLRFASDDPQDIGENLGTHNPTALSVVKSRLPFSSFSDGTEKPNRPDLYSETYLPVFKDGRMVAIAEVYIDQTQTHTEIQQEYAIFGLGILILALLSFSAPVITTYNALRRLRRANRLLEVERKRAVASSKAKSEFISTVSHELRTPLTSIKVPLELLQVGKIATLTEAAQDLVTLASKNANILLSLVNDILDFQMIGSGKIKMERQPEDIVTVTKNAIETFKWYGADQEVDFVFEGDDDPVMVDVDAERITQVIGNLLSNGAKFSPSGSTVFVSVSERDDAVRVTVRDEGCGIAEENRDLVFEKFSQADSSDTRAVGGTGLGLAIAKEIVERHGGKIGFESQLGKGSAFYFELSTRLLANELIPFPLKSAA